jgi:hypothetical protein
MQPVGLVPRVHKSPPLVPSFYAMALSSDNFNEITIGSRFAQKIVVGLVVKKFPAFYETWGVEVAQSV